MSFSPSTNFTVSLIACPPVVSARDLIRVGLGAIDQTRGSCRVATVIRRALRQAALATAVLAIAAAAPAIASTTFKPRVGKAMGLMPPAGATDIAQGTP